MKANLFKNFGAIQKQSWIISAILIALMFACVATAYAQLLSRFVLDTWFGFFPFLCGFISIEVFISHRRNEELTQREKISFHLAEIITILVVLKVLLYIFGTSLNILNDIADWQFNFGSFFFEPHYLLTLAPILGIWVLSIMFANDLDHLQMDENELRMDNHEILERDRRPIRQKMIEIIVFVGMVALMLSIGARIDLKSIGILRPDTGIAISAPEFSVVIYFLLAMAFLSQTQFDMLRGSWMWGGAHVSPKLGWSWLRYGLIFFAGVALLAYALPTRYTVGLLDLIGLGFSFISQVIIFFYVLVISVFIALLNWLASLFGKNVPPQTLLPAIQPSPPPLIAGQVTPVPWIEILKSLLFWTVFIGVIGYFLVYYLRQNRWFVDLVKRVRWMNWIAAVFARFLDWLRGTAQTLVAAFQNARERLFSAQGDEMNSLIRPGLNFQRMNPRQRILFFYMNLIQRGSQRGYARKVSQTPIQYTQNLHSSFPEIHEELEGMTDAFIEARYTRHEIEPEKASFIQELWKRVIQALRRMKKGG